MTACALVLLALPCLVQSLPQEIFAIDRFEIGKTTLEDVQSHFGPNKPHPIELGDGADIAVCYLNGTASSAPAILFETGALGAWKEITAYRLTKRGNHQCSLTSVPLSTISTSNGLTFNTKRRFVFDILHQSKLAVSTTARIRIEEVYQRAPTDEEAARMSISSADTSQIKFEVVDTVEIGFRGGAVDDLYVKRRLVLTGPKARVAPISEA